MENIHNNIINQNVPFNCFKSFNFIVYGYDYD